MNKIKYLLSVLMIFAPTISWAACGGSSPTWTAADCSYAEVKACHDGATAGDTINVPACSETTWATTLTITKGILLIGAGAGETNIKRGATNGLFIFNPTDYDTNASMRISGFTINCDDGMCIYIGPSGLTGKQAPFTVQDKFRMDHNVFTNMGGNAIWNKGVAYGVIDNNTMTHTSGSYPIKNDPQVINSYHWWTDSPQKDYQIGSNKNMYFEDNVINLGGSGDNICAECQYGGRYAFRYNTINTTIPSYSFFEMHGAQGSGDDMPSCFGAEVYGNNITATNDDIILFKTRGGQSVIFGNSGNSVAGQWEVVAYTSLTVCGAEDECKEAVHDSFQWQNRLNYTGNLAETSASGSLTCCELTNRPLAGRDLVGEDSTQAITYGTLANLPATCTKYQGYWATSQSLSNLTNYVGVNPTTPLSGTLYQCTATNTWTEIYTPYTYPHPLRGEGTAQYTLTASKAGTGTGTVTSSPAGINCGVTCTYDYDESTEVTLTATPTGDNTFAGWSGTGGCTGTSTCVLTMSAAKAATATFNLPVAISTMSGGGMSGGSIR